MTFASIFVYAYNLIYGRPDTPTIFDHFKRETEGKGYIYLGDEEAKKRIEAGDQIGRLDAIMAAFDNVSKDPGELFFGIGIGNTLSPKIGFLAYDNDKEKYSPSTTTISFIVWEKGIVGLFIQLLLLAFIFKDALYMRNQHTFLGVLCLSWTNVTGIMFLTFFYQNVYNSNPLSITFWLFSGIVISKSYEMRRLQSSQKNQSSAERDIMSTDWPITDNR
jgi:hypothetical protein